MTIIREFSPYVYVLTGPTASGKTALGIELAERWNAEIVAMDSMTLYRGLDIGTAKPTVDERRGVPHHLLDVLDPWDSATVAWWLAQATDRCRDIRSRGRNILLVGGTPLYLKAVLQGLFEGPTPDRTIRERLQAEAADRGSAALHLRLAVCDPNAAARLHPNDLRRVVRALEVFESTARPISDWQGQWSAAAAAEATELAGNRCLWLDTDRDQLYSRINQRVLGMFSAGLVHEVRALRSLERPLSRAASQALGYKEVFDCLDGRATYDETIERVQRRSRNFAKRQMTWFRHLPGCRPATRELTIQAWSLTMS